MEGKFKSPTTDDLTNKLFGIRYGHTGEFQYFSGSRTSITLPSSSSYYSLSKNSISADMFDVIFDKSELLNNSPGFWIQLTATPKDAVGGEVAEISGYIGVCQSASGEASWTGYINDESYGTTDYDAYNYIVSGYGEGTFCFAWDDTKVKPNEFSLINYDLTALSLSDFSGYKQYGTTAPTGGTWKYVTISVDSDVIPRYEFQLYKTGGDDYSNTISQYVDYKFVAPTGD